MHLSIIINFFNMRREAERTLYSLTKQYQKNVDSLEYEVICIDHGSTIPINTEHMCFDEDYFEYRFISTNCTSPCIALNDAVSGCNGEYVMVCIDGARIFSPSLLSKSMEAAESCSNPFVFTLNAHIGREIQYIAIQSGYTQKIEDQLLEHSGWRTNGYELFNISCLGGAATATTQALPSESNTPLLKKNTYLNAGGYNPAFVSPGGGLSNLEFFSRIVNQAAVSPILLIGEASFHQSHGGTITGATGMARTTKFADMHREYEQIKGRVYEKTKLTMSTFGSSSPEWEKLINSNVPTG